METYIENSVKEQATNELVESEKVQSFPKFFVDLQNLSKRHEQ